LFRDDPGSVVRGQNYDPANVKDTPEIEEKSDEPWQRPLGLEL
jgi:hypothetical protein